MPKKDKLLIIDSFALIFRAYYAYPPTLTTRDGELINAVYGFSSLLLDVLKKFEPTHVIAVFDSASPTIRSTEFVAYKANRKERDDDLMQQIPKVRELIDSFDIPVTSVDGYEADDVIATLCKRYPKIHKIVVTGDQDLFQLINDNTDIYMAGKTFSQSKIYRRDDVKEKLGIWPEQVPDYKGLCGDPSDNIPGVKGIGKKSAEKLLNQFKTIEEVYENLDKVDNRSRTKLQDDYEMAMKSKGLATVVYDVPLSFDLNSSVLSTIDINKVLELMREFDFKSLIKKVEALGDKIGTQNNVGLFDGELEVQTQIKTKQYVQKDLENITKLFITADVDVSSKSPIGYKFEKLYFVTEEKQDLVIEVGEDAIGSFLGFVLEKNIRLIGVNIKDLFHSFMNNSDYLKNPRLVEKLTWEDLGYAAQILSLGRFGHTENSVFDFVRMDIPGTLMEKVNLYPLIYGIVKEEFEENKDSYKVYELEKSILEEVLYMEQTGISLDVKKIKSFEEKLEKKKAELTTGIYEDVGHEFNINSPKQVSEVLFDEKGLPVRKKTKGGAKSTSERALKFLIGVDPVVEKILNYREIDKLLSTYVKTLPGYMQKDGRIHATFDQLGTVSGRFSSNNPNMQNIPPNNEKLGVNIREAFVSSENSVLVAFDYSQQELRILSAMAKEKKMMDSFNRGDDIHKLTASQLFGKALDQVSKDERHIGKTINFSIVYGVSAFGLAEQLQIDRSEGQLFIDKFYEEYPNIKRYFDTVKKSVAVKGYAESIMGRKRENRAVNAKQWFMKSAAERELLNFTVQGSAADLMKVAMKDMQIIMSKYPAKILLQVHDEFVFEYKVGDGKWETGKEEGVMDRLVSDVKFNEFVKAVKEIMVGVMDIGVSYKVDVKVGENWGNMEEVRNPN